MNCRHEMLIKLAVWHEFTYVTEIGVIECDIGR